jgi:Na+-driven multidrug efflux pump
MDAIREKAGIVSVVLLNIINALLGFGVVLPHGVDAQGVALANTAALSIAALILHFVKPKASSGDAPAA